MTSERLCSSAHHSLMCLDAPDRHVAYTGFVEHLARMHARALGGALIGLQALALLCAGGFGHGHGGKLIRRSCASDPRRMSHCGRWRCAVVHRGPVMYGCALVNGPTVLDRRAVRVAQVIHRAAPTPPLTLTPAHYDTLRSPRPFLCALIYRSQPRG
ncbi:hypothetical protein C8J57DRAFT_1365101 [Mycena rebaudengoi]|nr:hypothetical protein C8J57DRAFT_1365101 [Mycena rebaudengoi]